LGPAGESFLFPFAGEPPRCGLDETAKLRRESDRDKRMGRWLLCHLYKFQIALRQLEPGD
jgi:hypothetical protein